MRMYIHIYIYIYTYIYIYVYIYIHTHTYNVNLWIVCQPDRHLWELRVESYQVPGPWSSSRSKKTTLPKTTCLFSYLNRPESCLSFTWIDLQKQSFCMSVVGTLWAQWVHDPRSSCSLSLTPPLSLFLSLSLSLSLSLCWKLFEPVPCRANMTQTRQSGPDSGLGFQVKVHKKCLIVLFSLGLGLIRTCPMVWLSSFSLSLARALSLYSCLSASLYFFLFVSRALSLSLSLSLSMLKVILTWPMVWLSSLATASLRTSASSRTCTALSLSTYEPPPQNVNLQLNFRV